LGKTSVVQGIPDELPPTPVDFDSPLPTNLNLSDHFSKESKKIWHDNLLSRPSSKLDTIQVEATEAGDFTRGTEACPARIVITIFAPFWARIIFSVWARIIFKPMEVLINSRGEEVTFQKPQYVAIFCEKYRTVGLWSLTLGITSFTLGMTKGFPTYRALHLR